MRERQVLVWIGRGLTNAEIAVGHTASETGMKTLFGHVLARTGSCDRVQAVALAFRTGLVT